VKNTPDVASGLLSDVVARQKKQIESTSLIAERREYVTRKPPDSASRDGTPGAPAERHNESAV
jgi:hypothetical protein